MYLTRHRTSDGTRWAADGRLLPPTFTLGLLLELPADAVDAALRALTGEDAAEGPLLAPIDAHQEVWASGVTYLKSREAREAESRAAGGSDVYARVYDAERPELFFKAPGWRVVGPDDYVAARADAHWTVPEPELVLVLNRHLDIVGFSAGNDASSRDIEGANPLYLPQAKIYDRSCALGPGIVLARADDMRDLVVRLAIARDGDTIFSQETRTSEMKRAFEELAEYLGRALTFPQGAFLMTGTSIVPPDEYSVRAGDEVVVTVASLELRNRVLEKGAVS